MARLSLRSQLRRTVLLAFGASLAVTAAGLVKVSRTLEAVGAGLERLELVPRIGGALASTRLLEERLAAGDSDELEPLHRQLDALESDVRALGKLTDDASFKKELDQLVAVSRAYREQVDAATEVLTGKRHFDDPTYFRTLQSGKRKNLAAMQSTGEHLLQRESGHTFTLLRSSFTELAATLLAVVVVALGGIALLWRTGRNLVGRVTGLAASTRVIASGSRLDLRLQVDRGDELGDLASEFNGLLSARAAIVDQLVVLVRELGVTTVRINDAAREVGAGTEEQHVAATAASSSVDLVVGRLREIARGVSATAREAQDCAIAANSIVATGEDMAEQAGHAATAVDETSRSTETLSRAIDQVAARTHVLSESARTTATAMSDAGAAIVRMRTSAADAARISERVTAEAAAGADAIREAIEGVEQIRAETDQVVLTIGELADQVGQISAVVEVIEAVADQTKLLALNASILAASVGEAGAGFAVVASSIKELAARTRGSTDEIAQMIRAAQRAAEGARGASGRIALAVSEGVSRSLVAERALQSILDGVRTAREVTAQMAPAAEEQSRGADAVMQAMGGVASSVEVIAQAATEQADELRRIHRNMERLREVAQRVRTRSGEQQAAARRVAQTVEGAATRIALVERAHAEQSGANEQLQLLVRTIALVTERYRGVAKTLEQSAADLSGGASRLLDRTRQLE